MRSSRLIKVGWAFVSLLILVLVVFAFKRSVDTFSGQIHEAVFELRYLEHPWISALHMLSGIAFICLAPLQFVTRIRLKRLSLHRRLGRVLVVMALISGVYGIAASLAFPAFGGLASETAGLFFGPLFIFAIVRAFLYARAKEIKAHQRWMIRAFALGLAVGTQRVLLILLMVFTSSNFEESFGPALWLGFSINLLIAEAWISKRKLH